jgi:membrane-associated phospholipid phosphatase
MDFPWVFAQTSSRFIPIYAMLFGLISFNHYLILFSILAILNGILNCILKIIFKILYIKLGSIDLPLLGRGIRPTGAQNCSDMPTLSNFVKKATSFGMPSGHSQNAWFFFTFISLYIYHQYKNKPHNIYNQMTAFILIIILFIISTFISYSRVKINCHSTNQVIIGGIIGAILGIFGYLLTQYIIEGY